MRVYGHLKSFKENSRSLIAFGLSPVTDFNEITYHMLDVIHSHLALSKVTYFISKSIIKLVRKFVYLFVCFLFMWFCKKLFLLFLCFGNTSS